MRWAKMARRFLPIPALLATDLLAQAGRQKHHCKHLERGRFVAHAPLGRRRMPSGQVGNVLNPASICGTIPLRRL
jgi:hypothetical protein